MVDSVATSAIQSNGDEDLVFFQDEGVPVKYIGNFHKTLSHNKYGEVVNEEYEKFSKICENVVSGASEDFEAVPSGADKVAKLINPLAGASKEYHGPDPKDLSMSLPAPGILSLSTAAEMVELYWMALLRDKPLSKFDKDEDVAAAEQEIGLAYQQALNDDDAKKYPGKVNLDSDLPKDADGKLKTGIQNLFRCGLKGEEYGPLISQFFLRDVSYGVQTINQSLIPYAPKINYLITYEEWIRAQNTGFDKYGKDYGMCNFADDEPAYYDISNMRKIATMRDLARFVNRDALHQAYFNAALFLLSIDAPLDVNNPYDKNGKFKREVGFGTLGGPDLLTLVSEVASRALKVVWRQKWLVHRRARPEVYGGLLHMQERGYGGMKRPYGLPDLIRNSKAAERIYDKNNGTYFLPMAFSAGSPAHPAYGAGHATVAGACVTILKAWFDETAKFTDVFKNANLHKNAKEPNIGGNSHEILRTADAVSSPGMWDHYGDPVKYVGSDAKNMTIGGELNKLASNVAMGRSMGGVHWRTDNTRSLRLGEEIAIHILEKRVKNEYAEKEVGFTFTRFDGTSYSIKKP